MKSLFLAAIVCLLVGTSSVTFFNYNFNTNTNLGTNAPYYPLGYIYQSNTIQVNLTVPGTSSYTFNQLVITLRNASHIAIGSTVDTCATAGAGVTTCYITYNILAGSNYYVQI